MNCKIIGIQNQKSFVYRTGANTFSDQDVSRFSNMAQGSQRETWEPEAYIVWTISSDNVQGVAHDFNCSIDRVNGLDNLCPV